MLTYTRPSRFSPAVHKVGTWLYRFLFWSSHRKSKQIIVPSNYVAQQLANLHPFARDRTKVTYEATEPPLDIEPEPLKGINRPFILHVGTPLPHKNIERLMKAFETLKQARPDLLLVLPGKMKDQFKTDFERWLARNDYKDSIIAPGFVSDSSLLWLYQNAEAYVLPSLSEGFGLPGLEAMAHGCPLVSSNATCLPEIYGEAAIYFDPEDIADMSQKIAKVLDDKQLREDLIKKGFRQIKKYSWDEMARQTLDIYQKAF